MTAPQIVCTATAAVVTVAIALAVAGVAMLVGAAWALIAAGCLLGPTAVGAGAVLLRDDGHSK